LGPADGFGWLPEPPPLIGPAEDVLLRSGFGLSFFFGAGLAGVVDFFVEDLEAGAAPFVTRFPSLYTAVEPSDIFTEPVYSFPFGPTRRPALPFGPAPVSFFQLVLEMSTLRADLAFLKEFLPTSLAISTASFLAAC
jgi:hypothetical protein